MSEELKAAIRRREWESRGEPEPKPAKPKKSPVEEPPAPPEDEDGG